MLFLYLLLLSLSLNEQLDGVGPLMDAIHGRLMALAQHGSAVDLEHFVAHSEAGTFGCAVRHQFGDEQTRVIFLKFRGI